MPRTMKFRTRCNTSVMSYFRNPAPAYKHSAAVFLQMAGRIPSDRTHPRNPQRPQREREILRDCLRRLFPDKDESQLNGAGSIQKELGDTVSSRWHSPELQLCKSKGDV